MVFNQSDKTRDNSLWLRAYMRQIASYKSTCTAETETQWVKKASQGCKKSKERLIKAHLSLVVSLARKYMKYESVILCDLIQDGNIGLMRAAEKFDYKKGYRFSTYATWWIKQALMQSFSEHDRLVRLPGHTITDLAKIKRAMASAESSETRTDSSITDEHLAQQCQLSVKKVRLLLPYINKVQSLDSHKASDEESPRSEGCSDIQLSQPGDFLGYLAKQELYAWVRRYVYTCLDEKERKIISARYMYDIKSPSTEKMSLNALGALFSTSRETIRQVETRTLQRIKREILLQEMYD